jgi:hypothetical protein
MKQQGVLLLEFTPYKHSKTISEIGLYPVGNYTCPAKPKFGRQAAIGVRWLMYLKSGRGNASHITGEGIHIKRRTSAHAVYNCVNQSSKNILLSPYHHS